MSPYYKPGTYRVRIIEQAFGETKNGNPMITFRIQPRGVVYNFGLDDEHLEPITDPFDRHMRLVVSDNEKQKEFAIKKLRFAGFKGNRFENLQLEGKEVYATCAEGHYEGKETEEWELALPPLERDPLEHDPTVAKRLNALFGKTLTSSASEEQEASEDYTQAPVDGDDNIPF